MGETYKKNGKGIVNLLSLYNNPVGRIDAIDTETNELITLRTGGKIVEFMGMVKGGKSKHIQLLCDSLRNDTELTEILGNPIEIEIFKPNILTKVLFEKDPRTRGSYNEAIIYSHGLVLNMLYLQPKGDMNIPTREIDLALMDRGPNDDIVWTYVLHDYKGYLSDGMKEEHLNMARNLERYIDLAIGINVPPFEAMRREGEREGNVMNFPFLQQLYKQYQQLSIEAEKLGQPSTIQTSYLDINGFGDIQNNAERIYKRVRGLYNPKTTEELRYSDSFQA